MIDKAWAARAYSGDRIGALSRQVAADRRTIDAYTKEYELGQRSLIDLLNAQNSLFSASVSLVSIQSLAIFADFQMLAAMGHLLAYLNEPHSIDAEPLTLPFGFVPLKLAPVRILDPDIKSELLPVKQTIVEPSLAPSEHPTPVSPKVRFGRPEDALFQAPYWTVNFSWMSARAYMQRSRCEGADDRRGRAGDVVRADELHRARQPPLLAAEADRRQVTRQRRLLRAARPRWSGGPFSLCSRA